MASGGAEEDGGIPLDIDNVHMLLQVEQEQIQKRTFTNWINAQLAKRCPPSFISNLFSDLRDGSQLLDLLEVMSGQSMKRQRGRGVFQQRANIETALDFLKKKSIKLVNINIPDIIDGRPSIILGLIWSIILHCHIEELANALSFSSRHSSLDSLSSLDSWSGGSVPSSPVPAGRTSPLHRRFRISAKKALLMWVRDQCQKVHCSVSVKNFKSSWRSGEAFLAILCSLRPQLVDLSLVQSRSNQENLEEAFHLAERELLIPRLLEPQDVDVNDPDEKSIMTYVAQFLQYSNDMPAPDDHLQLFPSVQPSSFSPMNLPPHFTPAIAISSLQQVSSSERAQQVTCWLQQAHQELSEAWAAAETSSYADKYQVFQSLGGSFAEQRRPVMTLLATLSRHPELRQEERTLRAALDCLEEELQKCKSDLDLSLPHPLDSVVVWLQRAEAGLTDKSEGVTDHADAAKAARAQQDTLKTLNKEMGHYENILDTYQNINDSGNEVVPIEKFDEIKKRLTTFRVTAKYQGIQLEYVEFRHTMLDLLRRIQAKVQSWKAPYRSQEATDLLLKDWQDIVERENLVMILMDALQNLKDKAVTYTSKAALGDDYHLVTRQVKEAEKEAELVTQAVSASRRTLERATSAWRTYNKCLTSLQEWLARSLQTQSAAGACQDMSEWTSCQAQINQVGNFLIEVTETSTSLTLTEQLSKVNMQWAECMKTTKFAVSPDHSAGDSCLPMVHSLTQEASCLLRQPMEVSSVPLKATRQKLQLLSKKMAEVDMSSSSPSSESSHTEKLLPTLPSTLSEAERTCGELQRAASKLEGCLAELDHWSTDALDFYNHLKEKIHRGHSPLEPSAKVLVSRGLQLMHQAAADGQDLQEFVTQVQKTSPLQYLSTSDIQKRLSLAVSHSQEILEMFRSVGLKQQKVGESFCKTPKQPEKGSLVVAKTKHVERIGSVTQQTLDPVQLSPQQRTSGPQSWSKKQQRSTQHDKDIVITHAVIQTKSQLWKEPVRPHVKEAESELLMQPRLFSQSSEQVSSVSQRIQLLPAPHQTPAGLKNPSAPVLPQDEAGLVTKRKKPTSTDKLKHTRRTGGQLSDTSSQPPVMIRSEVHSKAQSMAKSRLEKARYRLQGRIQQAMKLFGGKEVSESQAKKKQKALKILQPAILEEFLGAVECFGAFCSGPQLQDLMFLSDSVRKQWEGVRREMADLIPQVWSKIRERKQSVSVVWCETHTNALGKATDQTDHGSPRPLQQAVSEGAASVEEHGESLSGLWETLTPSNSSCFASDQLREPDEVRETGACLAALPAEGRGEQLRGNTLLGATDMSADSQLDNNLPLKQSLDITTLVSPVRLHGDVIRLRVRDIQDQREDHVTHNPSGGPERSLKSSLRAREQLLKARLLDAENNQQTQSHVQAVVRSNTVETKQEVERTLIPETAAPSQAEHLSEQDIQKRYRESCLLFHRQLENNNLHLEQLVSDPVTNLSLKNHIKQLQTLKEETEALWFDVELQYAQLTKVSELMTREQDQGEVKQQLIQQWREQQKFLQTRMVSLESVAHLLKSSDDLRLLISEKLNQIISEPVNVSSLTFADPTMLSDLKEMNDRLQAEVKKLPQQSAAEERQESEATSPSSLRQALHNSGHHLEQLRQRLEKVQSAAHALDCFLATVREAEAEIPTPLAEEDSGWQKNEAEREQEGHSWRAAPQRLQAAAEQADGVDSSLKAVGMTVTVDGETVTCRDVLKCVSNRIGEMDRKLMSAKKKRSEAVIFLQKLDKIHKKEESIPAELHKTRTLRSSPEQTVTQRLLTSSTSDEELRLEAKRSRLEGEHDVKTQAEEEDEAQMWRAEGDALKTKDQRQRRISQVKKADERDTLVKKKAALLAALRETKGAAEELRLHEPTLPALQQRTRALTELERALAGLLSEVQDIRGASSQSELPDESEVEDVWEETTKAVSERLDQCRVLTQLLRSFQSLRAELSGTLQRAESTIGEQASYVGKNNLQRLHAKVQETKGELNGLGDAIEAVRSVCRQLHSHLRQIPDCTSVPFENEADTLMDRWLDLSERTDSHLENLHLVLTSWDAVLQLGGEVESWTDENLAIFTRCPSFQDADAIEALQSEIETQEENIQRFHQRSTEIQLLLQSAEFPLELQVVETQIRKKMEQLRELVSEAEDVYKQMVATKEQMNGRMEECLSSLQQIQDSLRNLKDPDVSTILAKLKELCWQLHGQDEQAESLLEDVQVIASIAGAESLHGLSESGALLRQEVGKTQQLFSELEEQTERNIQDLDRLQVEKEDLEQWLCAAEEREAKSEDLHLLKEETLQQSARTKLLHRYKASLQSSNLQQVALLEESDKVLKQYHRFRSCILVDSKETRRSVSRDLDVFSTLSKSTQTWVRHLRQITDSLPAGRFLAAVEQKLHSAQVVFDATAEGETRLEELRVTGAGLSHRVLNGDELKQEVEATIQKTEEQWRDLLKSTEPYYTAIKAEPELVSLYLAQRQAACRRVEELQHQTETLAAVFPWPATDEPTQPYRLPKKLLEECNSLQLTLAGLAERRRELAERTGNSIWQDSSWAELEVHGSALMAKLKGECSHLEEGVSNEDQFGRSLQDCQHKLSSLQERMSLRQTQQEVSAAPNTDVSSLEAFLKDVTDMEKDIIQLETLKDSMAVSSVSTRLSQEVSDLKSHKGALESSIREHLAVLGVNRTQTVQQIEAEASRLQIAVKAVAENVKDLSGVREVLPEISQLKQHWCTIQDLDAQLTELEARVNDLQWTSDSSVTQQAPPSDALSTVNAVLRDTDSLKSTILQRKQECAEKTANRIREVTGQLQRWSKTVKSEPSSLNQAAMDEGLGHQRVLDEVLSEQIFLLNCLGAKVIKKLRNKASRALKDSKPAFEMLSKCLLDYSSRRAQLESSEDRTQHSPSSEETYTQMPPVSSSSSATSNRIETQRSLFISEQRHPSTEPVADTSTGRNAAADPTKQDQTCILMKNPDVSVLCTTSTLTEKAEEDTTVPVSKSKIQQESQVTSEPPKIEWKTSDGSEHDGGTLRTDTTPLRRKQRSEHELLMPEWLLTANKCLANSQAQNRDNTSTCAKKMFTIVLDMEPGDMVKKENNDSSQEVEFSDTKLLEMSNKRSREKKPASFTASEKESLKSFDGGLESDKSEADSAAIKQEKHCEGDIGSPKKVFTVALDLEAQDMQENNAGHPDLPKCPQGGDHCDIKLSNRETCEKKSRPFTSASPESIMEEMRNCPLSLEEKVKCMDAQEEEMHCQDISGNPAQALNIGLDAKLQQKVIEESSNIPLGSSDVFSCPQREQLCDTKPAGVSNTGSPEKKSHFLTSSINPEQDETKLKGHSSCPGSDPSMIMNSEHEKEGTSGANEGNQITHEPKHIDVLSSHQSCVTAAECVLIAPHEGETTLPHVKQEEISGLCHSKEQTESSLSLCTVEDSLQTGDDLAQIQIPAAVVNQVTVADLAQPAGSACERVAEGEDTEETNKSKMKCSKVPKSQDSPPKAECESESSTAVKDSTVTQAELQCQGGTESESVAAGMAAEETTGGSFDSCKQSSTMQDILAEVQSLVERSNVINRTPHLDLNWYLKFSPGEPEIRLIRTVQQVLACRYQPAQLSVKAMATQLDEAEEYRRLVQEQVAVMKSISATEARDPSNSKAAEGQWSAALLDASATVQVKVAQLDQVKQYHRLMKIAKVFLEVLASEKEKANLNALGSSGIQAEQLSALLQTMEQKKHIMEELLLLSSQLSVHLSDAESSGALLAQLGDVQEEWRLLEGSIKRALRHASNSTCQSSLLLKESQLLKAKLEALQISNCENLDSKGALEMVCLTTDLKLYNQLYRHLQSQSDSLISFSLGQKEKEEIRRSLKDLESFLSVTKNKVDSLTYGCGINLSMKLNRQLRDLIIFAKQAENHISVGEKLALFPEEARIQIAEIKKFQTDILSRRSKMQMQFEQIASDMENEESEEIFKTVVDLYDAISASLAHILDTMKKNLKEREKLLCQLAGMDAWLAETHAQRDPCNHVENVSNTDVRELESELKSHKIATAKLESSLKLLESLSDACEKIATELSPGESRYLVNRISGLWTELDGLLAHEKATCWELEELFHERMSSDQELSSIQASLKQISASLEQQRFPLTQATHSLIAHLKHMLMEHQCELQELKHCQETKRNSVLCSIAELQDRCKSLSTNTLEQQKYLHLRRQMTESRDIADKHVQFVKNKTVSVEERFKVCQALLVELPLIKTQCQEAADQLEAIAQEFQPSDLEAEKEKIHATVETLVSWEQSAGEDIKNLETEFLPDLRFNSELPAFKEVLENTRAELEQAKPVSPNEKAIDIALQQYWVMWRSMESGMRVLEGLGRKENINMKEHKQLYSLRDAVMHECHSQMDNLSLARESLKDYQWAAQGAIGFLHNAEATFLSAPGGFLDCTEEQRQTQQALEALEDGFQAHICHLMERVPQQRCLSGPETEQLHIDILSQLLVGRAVLEAQAQLRLETLKRCEMGEQTHRKCHEDVRQHLSGIEAQLTDCAAQQVTSYEKCIAQQRRAQLLMEDLRGLAVKIEDLRAGCPMQGCGVGKDGELGALWRRRVSLRRGVGLLMAHTEQRGEEWKDITASMEQCCSFLASLQADVPDSSAVSFTQDEPQELLAQAEMHQAGLEQEQQALASLEHRLEHALSLSTSHEPTSPGPVGKTLVKIQENVRSLKERNLLVVAAAQAEERERQQVQEEIEKVEKDVLTILQSLDACSSPSKRQSLHRDLFSQRTKLKCITDSVQSRYAEIPADIGRTIQDVHLSLQQTEAKLMESNSTVRKLSIRVKELDSGLEKVKALLEERSPTLIEAQNVLKHAWDELDTWHSSLMLLESEVQDLAEEQPNQAQLLIDQLTQPLQLYQNASQMAEQRTSFLNRIPACLQEYEDLLFRTTCWLDEAQTWVSSPCSFTTARSMQNHAKSLQLVIDDSERLGHNLQDFGSALEEISCVCDMSSQKEQLDHNHQQVQNMQSSIQEPLEQLRHAVGMVEAMEAEIKAIEKNIPKIRTILSSMDISYIPLTEHLQNRQVILANVQSMRKTLEAIEGSRLEFHMLRGAEQSLLVFSRPRQLLQPLGELEQLAQQQASQLETQIREEGETNTDPGITTVSNAAREMQQLGGSLHRRLVQEAFELSNSEEEEDEEDENHSSSSDTLTCSIPEDLLETFNTEDMAEIEAVSDIQELECPERTDNFSSLVEKSPKDAQTKVSPLKPEFNTNFVSESAEKELQPDAGKAFIPETVAAASVNTTAGQAVYEQLKVAVLDRLESPEHEARTETPRAAAVVEDTRLIPSRPVNPISAKGASDEFIEKEEEEDEDLPLSTPPQPDPGQDISLRQQSEVNGNPSSLMDGPHQPRVSSEASSRFASHPHDEEELQRWSQLHSQITQKLNALKKVNAEDQTVNAAEDGGDRVEAAGETESASSVLQQTHESISILRKIVKDGVGSHPGSKEELYKAVQSVLLSLDSLTNFGLTPADADGDEPQMKLLRQECVSAEVATLAELMSKVESQTRPALSQEEAEACSCLTGLQHCLHTVQLVLTSSRGQPSQRPEVKSNQELSSRQMCLLEEFEQEQNEIVPSLKDALSLECVLGRHLRESPGERAQLQHASQSLLQGIARLLALGEECIRERQTSRVHNSSKLQVVLCRDKKLLQVLRSQLAFVRHLFQHEPEALGCQEDQRVQLEVGAEALQQQALEQDVTSQRTLQEWTRWEDNCGQLGRVLDESEAFISSGEPEGDDDEESVLHRLDACQHTLVQLDESRAALGLLLDQGKLLQAEPGFAAPVSQTGGALELRWRSAYKRTEQEIQRCRDIQESRARFQADFSSVSEWLPAANEHLKTLSGPAGSSQPSRECAGRNLIQLLDFSMDVEAMSALRASASKHATQLLHLREADCPELRTQLSQQEISWNQLTSGLLKTQEQLQQHLLAEPLPVELLSDMEEWLEKAKSRLKQEKERVLKAENAAQINEILQHYQVLKAAIANGQLLLDFLSQPEPQMTGKDVQARRAERTMFAEKLGTCKLQWLNLQRELQNQIQETEEMHQNCVERERCLPRLHRQLKQQRKQLNELKRPTSQTLARESLQEWEDVEGRVKEEAAALQELESRRVHAEQNKEHPCDVAFSEQAERVRQACEDLTQQMAALRPTLQETLENWSHFHEKLRDVSLDTTRARCALQHQRVPLLSLKQAEGYSDFLQQLQVKIEKGNEAWLAVDKSCQCLGKRLHHTSAQRLSDQVEVEQKRRKDLMQELKDERMNAGKLLPLWQKYVGLSESCALHRGQLWHQWEELSHSPPAPEQEISSFKKLQDAAEELQSGMGDVLEASKHLIGRLEPPAVNLVVSETRLLSRDVLLLNKATSARMKRLQEDSEQHRIFLTQLEVLEKETQNLLQTPTVSMHDSHSVKQVFSELSSLFPSLVDIREMSTCLTLNEKETDRLHTLRREWVKSMTGTSNVIRELQAERQHSQDFQEKRENLKSIQEKLERESVCGKSPSYSSLREKMAAHQRLRAEVIVGHQLLQGLQCDAVKSLERETGVERFNLLKQVARMKENWCNCIASTDRNWASIKEQLCQWRIYRRGSKRLWKLLLDIDSVLPPPGTSLFTLHQLVGSSNDYQRVNECLNRHFPVYTQTLEAGKHLCEAMTESDCQSRLQSELQAIEEAWERTSQLRRRRDHVNATVQMWSTCQDGINNIASELSELMLKKPDDSQEEAYIQETELSLQSLSGGLRELATMKTDLSQYVAASDSALLEQQLEQLHGQWEELCMKVSLRRQEIADRLNAWTIFNDKNKEFCDWLTQMENKVCHSGDLSIEEMVEKLKKDCMEEINLFSENKSHLKHLGEQLLLASDEAKQTQVRGSLQEVNQHWHSLFCHIEARVKKLKETLVTVQQLDKNMSNLRSWLSRIEAELSRPITYSVCHEQEIQKRLAEQQDLQRDIEQHTEGVASVLNLCDVLLRDEDAAGGTEAESDSLQETSRSLDQRWRTICAMALDRRLRIEETWTLWCKFLNDYSRFEDWLKMAERTAANPNSADVLFTAAKEELKKFEGFQRQVHERLTQLELVNNQYRRLARENRTDRASQLRAMVHEGNRRWDALHRRVAAILRRLKHFTGQREEFEGLRESMLVWLTQLDLQLTNVEHFSESDVHQKIQQLNSFQKEITLNTERIDGLIVFGEGLIQKSSPQDAALIEDELEELHSYCQEVFSRLVRFHQRLSQPTTIKEDPELSSAAVSLESSLELIGRPLLGRGLGSLPATPTHLLASPLERSGRETPMSVESLPLEWDHTGDVGGSSSHEDDEEEDPEDEGAYFSALSELTERREEFFDAPDALQASSLVPTRSMVVRESPRWRPSGETDGQTEAPPTLTSTPLKPGYLRLMSQCSGSIENIKRLSLMLDDEEQQEEFGLTGLTPSDKQSGVIERWELLQAQSGHIQPDSPQEPPQLQAQLHDITSWLETVTPALNRLQQSDPAASIQDMEARAKELKELQKSFSRYKSVMLSVNLRAEEAPELQDRLTSVNRDWSRACTSLQQWDTSLRKTLVRCQEFHETLHSLLLWLAHAESRRYAVDISHPDTTVSALQQHRNTLTELQDELQSRQTQQASLQALWSQLQPEDGGEEGGEAQEKLHVTGSKLKLLLRQVDQDLSTLQQRLDCDSASAVQNTSADPSQEAEHSKTASSPQRERRESSPPRSFFYRVLRAAFPLHLLLLLLLLIPCLIPMSESDASCTVANNFARSFYPMLHYTNGPPPT